MKWEGSTGDRELPRGVHRWSGKALLVLLRGEPPGRAVRSL